MQGIKALANQRVLEDLGTLVSPIYSVNKSHWLINKSNVGKCGRCLCNKSAVAAAPQSQHGSLVLSHFPQRAALDAGSQLEELLQIEHLASQPSYPRSLWFLPGMCFDSVGWRWSRQCRKWADPGSICCCQGTSSSPSSITGDMGWCRIWLGRFNVSQGAASTGMGNVEEQTWWPSCNS